MVLGKAASLAGWESFLREKVGRVRFKRLMKWVPWSGWMFLKMSCAGAWYFVAMAGLLFGHEFTDEEKAWWAVQPLKKVEAPLAEGIAVDGFVNRKLAASGLEMAGGGVG